MCDRMQVFTPDELNLIHNTSMDILMDAGVRFIANEALEIFRHHGFKTDGTRVFFTEKDVTRALETVPPRFTIRARNPVYNVLWEKMTLYFCPLEVRPTSLALKVNGGQRRWLTTRRAVNSFKPPTNWI